MQPFSQYLSLQTEGDRLSLTTSPIVQQTLAGRVDIRSYLAFLTQAYHHVRHTVPLLRAFRSALPGHLEWMQGALHEYIVEEDGHDKWILDDIANAGGDAVAAARAQPHDATELMVAYAWHVVERGNPVGFLGMIHVLEGTSVALALRAADHIQRSLGLPDRAMTYLRSHGTLDQEHTKHLAVLLDALERREDRARVVHCTRIFYRLYGDVLRSIPLADARQEAA